MDFAFKPLFNVAGDENVSLLASGDPLGPLSQLTGSWKGTGFNTIWRPLNDPKNPNQHHFLELNLTVETIDFGMIPGAIPNRGLLQEDLIMFGLHYLQVVNDNLGNGLHLEPGVWLNIPSTSNPLEPETIARLGSVPHGTSILAQGLASSESRAPRIVPADITPFVIGNRAQRRPFPESNLSIPTPFRSPPPFIDGITQAMVDDPNSVLTDVLAGQRVINTTNLIISTLSGEPALGGGTANTAFLKGGADGPNADAARMSAIFWIEEVDDGEGGSFLQLQYTQTVLLDFNGLSWPHVSVATLRAVPPPPPAPAPTPEPSQA